MCSALKNRICHFSLLTRILNCQNIGEIEIWLHGSNNQQEKNGPGNHKSGNQSFVVEEWGCYIFLLPVQRNFISALLHSFMLQKGTASGKPLSSSPRDSPIFLETQNYLTCSLPDSHGFFIFPYHQKGVFPDCKNFWEEIHHNTPWDITEMYSGIHANLRNSWNRLHLMCSQEAASCLLLSRGSGRRQTVSY